MINEFRNIGHNYLCENIETYQYFHLKPFKRQIPKMVKHTQTIRRQIADELFECVWPFCGIGT